MATNFKRIRFFEQDQIEDPAAKAKQAKPGQKPEENKGVMVPGEKTI